MKPPRLPADHPDRYIECEEMMEARLVALMDRARELGWTQDNVASAVTELAFNCAPAQGECGHRSEIAEDIARNRSN